MAPKTTPRTTRARTKPAEQPAAETQATQEQILKDAGIDPALPDGVGFASQDQMPGRFKPVRHAQEIQQEVEGLIAASSIGALPDEEFKRRVEEIEPELTILESLSFNRVDGLNRQVAEIQIQIAHEESLRSNLSHLRSSIGLHCELIQLQPESPEQE